MIFCEDCKYLKEENKHCMHEKVVLSPVDGSVCRHTGNLASTTRYSEKFCTIEARWFIPSFDVETWRLHSGEKAEIVYE